MNKIKRVAYNYIIPFIGKLFINKNQFINVIYYHDIVKGNGYSFMRTNIDLFKQQMYYIYSEKYKTFRFDDLKDGNDIKFDKDKVIIAFDDGWLSNYTEIYELMQSLNIKYNIFLTIKEIGNNPEYLTWDIVRKMHEGGLVGFGAHTYTHPHVADLKEIDTELEFNRANEAFKRELGYIPLDFCYPYGDYTERSNDYLINHSDYIRIYTSDMMYSYRQNNRIIFGRNGISNDEPFMVFKAKLNGYFNIWKSLIK